MNWFWYGYGGKGHGLYGEVDDYYRHRVKEFIERQAHYERLPQRIPYVGHGLVDDDAWLVLGKPSESGTFYGRIVDERQYESQGFSPYRLISTEPPDEPILTEVGSPLEWAQFPLPVDSIDYLQFAARLFEGLSIQRRRNTHHSIVPSEQAADGGTFFVFARGSDNAALRELAEAELLVQGDDGNGVLLKEVADLSRTMELVNRRLGDTVTIPLLREEFKEFGGKIEKRVGDDLVATVCGKLRELEQVLPNAADWSERLDRVEGALQALSRQTEERTAKDVRPPSRRRGIVGMASIVIVLVVAAAFLYFNLDQLDSAVSDNRTEINNLNATLINVAEDVAAIRTEVEAMKNEVEEVKIEIEAVKKGVQEIKDASTDDKQDIKDQDIKGRESEYGR